jgi:hypothetical protein
MRGVVVLAACGALLLQPASAYKLYSVTVNMSRANTSMQAAQHDGYACWKRTSPIVLRNGPLPPFGYLGGGNDIHRPGQVTSFIGCMQTRGYRLDSDGYQVASFRRVSET